MNLYEFFTMMILGILLYLFYIWASFADGVGILLRVFPIKKVPRGYDAMKKLMNSSQFKTHKKK